MHRKTLATLLLLISVATAYGIQHLIDDVLPARNLNGAVATIAALLVVQSVRAVLGVLRARYLLEANARVGTGIVDEFLQNLFAQPAEFYLGRGNGEYTSRLQDSVRVQGLVARAFGNTIVDCTIVGGAVLYLALLAPVWSIALLSALCMLAVVFGVASKHLEDRQRAMLQAYTETEARLLDASEGAVDVAAYGAGSTVCVATQQAHSEFQSCAQVLGGTVAEINMTADATGSTILLGSLCFGALAVMNGTMRLGAMMAAYSLVAQAIPAVLRIVDGASTLQAASLGLSRLLEYQATSSGAPGVSPAGGGASQDAGASIVSVCLDVVTFEWPGGQPLLERVSACFEAGRISSIHGRSGSGKSTLASIIAQQLRPTDGRVSYRDRRGQAGLAVAPTLSVVREHVKIFECSVFDNIGLGRSDVDHTAVSRAVEILRVDKFVSSLTGGLQTIVGKRGRSLSAGERQIIGLLRAFARIPEVLVLDECLNALDAEHRSEIVKGLQAFATEHVVVLISHHLQELHLHATGWLLEGGSLMRTAPGIELATERL